MELGLCMHEYVSRICWHSLVCDRAHRHALSVGVERCDRIVFNRKIQPQPQIPYIYKQIERAAQSDRALGSSGAYHGGQVSAMAAAADAVALAVADLRADRH